MEAFASYLLKSAIWLTGFAIVYFLFLRNERYFMLKRIYLVAGILISLLFPLITIHYQVEVPAPAISQVDMQSAGVNTFTAPQQVAIVKSFNYRLILLFLYLSGVVVLAFRAAMNFRRLSITIKKSDINEIGPVKLIRASQFPSSFSFFNYIFINPSVSGSEMEEIMNHEIVHVRQRHWFDLLLSEMLRLLQWMNPVAWVYDGYVRLNHEYLADEAALKRTANPLNYKAALVNQLFDSPVINLSNSFNYSLNKKRFEMMKKIITSPYRKMKVFIILPIFAIVFYAFATPEYHYAAQSEYKTNIRKDTAAVEKMINVKVKDDNGSSISGVKIEISGLPKAGLITGKDGQFTVGGTIDDKELTFTCEGYKTLKLKIKKDFPSEITVTMSKDQDYKEPINIGNSDGSMAKPLIVIDGVVS